VKMCLRELGSKPAMPSKLEAIFGKVKEEYSNIADIPVAELGHIKTAATPAEIKQMTLSTDEAVSAMGEAAMMSTAQLEAAYSRAKEQWSGMSGSVSGYTADNLVLLGQTLCGAPAADIESMDKDKLSVPLQIVAKAPGCKEDVREKLSAKFKEINGDPDTWDKATVNDMGSVVGGLEAMDLKKITPEAMGGLTAAGAQSIPTSKIGMLTKAQAENIPAPAARAFTAEQKDKLSAEAQTALDNTINEFGKTKSAAGQLAAQALIPLLLLAVALVRVN